MSRAWEYADREHQLADAARAEAQDARDAAADADHHDHRRPSKAEADEMRAIDQREEHRR